jgi:Icc protein
MRLAQISDTHIRPPGELAYGVLDTASLLSRAVSTLNELGDQIDAVLMTGDLVDAGRPEEYRYLRTLLDPLAKPYYLMAGNHDARGALRDAFADHLYLHQNENFIQYTFDVGPMRIIALDSLIERESGGTLCEARLAWLDAQLALTCAGVEAHSGAARPVIIAIHHPPFDTGIAEMDEIVLERAAATALEQIVRRYPNVERVLIGHVHRPMLVRFGGTIAVTCPSTAHQTALDFRRGVPLQFIMEPPGYALHDWHDSNRMVTHYLHTGTFGAAHPF